MVEVRGIEDRSAELVHEALGAFAAALENSGLQAGPVEVVRTEPSGGYSSEVSCWLYRDDAPEEFIEFEVFRAGEAVVDLDALPSWLAELLTDATRRRRG